MHLNRSVGIIFATISLCAALSAWLLRPRAPEVVALSNACNTFVSEVSPNRTPALRTGTRGMELILSFTPAKDEDARQIINAVTAGATKLRVVATNTDLKALRVDDGLLVLGVESVENAKSVLRQLCFEEREVAALSLARVQ